MKKTDESEIPDCIYEKHPLLICPNVPTPKESIYLSNLDDQKFLRFSIKYVYLFKKSVSREILKESLSRVLVQYYPLAGRIRRSRETNHDEKLEVDCNGKGAVFAEAKMDLSAEKFLELAINPKQDTNIHFRKLLYRVEAPSGFLDIPPLVIQVTNLNCGAMILCTAINHCICDGIGTSQFLHDWAYMTTNNSTFLPIKPFHSRHMLKPQGFTNNNNSYSHPGFTKTTPNETTLNITNYLQSQPLVPASITFSSSQILQLKRQCVKCTTFEILASHTWHCWVKSLELPHSMQVKLLFSTNVRNKLSPHMPQGYYGNAFVLACAEAKVKELVTTDHNFFHYGLNLVQRAKKNVTNLNVKSLIHLLEDKMVKTDLSATLVISQWSKLGLEELNFGQGKPIYMGPLISDIYCLFLPVIGDFEAVRVLISMPNNVVDKFKYYMTETRGIIENNTKKIYGVDNLEMVSV